jgi:hypothetical protein
MRRYLLPGFGGKQVPCQVGSASKGDNMKFLIAFLLLSGCAETSNNLRPTITEQDLGGGKRRVTLDNPYRDAIVAHVDCDGERDMRRYEMAPNTRLSFELRDALPLACTSEK